MERKKICGEQLVLSFFWLTAASGVLDVLGIAQGGDSQGG